MHVAEVETGITPPAFAGLGVVHGREAEVLRGSEGLIEHHPQVVAGAADPSLARGMKNLLSLGCVPATRFAEEEERAHVGAGLWLPELASLGVQLQRLAVVRLEMPPVAVHGAEVVTGQGFVLGAGPFVEPGSFGQVDFDPPAQLVRGAEIRASERISPSTGFSEELGASRFVALHPIPLEEEEAEVLAGAAHLAHAGAFIERDRLRRVLRHATPEVV